MKPFTLLDSATDNRARLYTDLDDSTTLAADEISRLDDCLKRGWAQGLHACLMLPYDFGRDLIGIAQTQCPMSILWYRQLTHLDNTERWLAQQWDDDQPAGVVAPELAISETAFAQRIADVHERIRAGETYQVNFTTHCHFRMYGHPLTLYRQLRRAQPAPYAALIYHGTDEWTLSLSPERFYSIEGRHIVSEPMKGTAPILGDGQDDARGEALAQDSKNRAENAMIVDLLRNDLGSVATLGSVRVRDPFAVKPYGKVWQMTSTVTAELRPDTTYADLIRATFPCGSITGAPKYRTMQLIDQLEQQPRGLYTGSIGYLDADGKGCFNVAIRTLSIRGCDGRLGVGGGVTIDSTADGEYAECHWKKAFLHHIPQPFTVFETIAVKNGSVPLLGAHLRRLKQSAQDLGFTCDHERIRHAVMQHLAKDHRGLLRLKISLHHDGHFELTGAACPPLSGPQRVMISEETLPVHDPLRRYKTSQRSVYDRAWQCAAEQGAFDGLVFNHDGYLLEGGRSNVFIHIDGQWYTPALDLDILPGILRQQVMNQPSHWLTDDPDKGSVDLNQSHPTYQTQPRQQHNSAHAEPPRIAVREYLISHDMLKRADTILLSNALRGLFPVQLIHR